MSTISLYKNGTRESNVQNYNTCFFDFEHATVNTDYTIIAGPTAAIVGDETVKSLRFSISSTGTEFLTDFDPDVASPNNLVPPVKYITNNGVSDIVDTAPLTIGERPSDWQVGSLYKYYTRSLDIDYGYYRYSSPLTYDNATQYYSVPNIANLFYTTDKKGFFGVSRSYQLDTIYRQIETVGVLYNHRLPYSSNDFYPTFFWKYGGAFGQDMFSIDFTRFPSYGYMGGYVNSGSWADYLSMYLVQLVEFTYQNEDYIGIATIRIAADEVPQEAQVCALSAKWWNADAPANAGPRSGRKGGHGSFTAPSTNRGDREGAYVANIVSQWQTGASNIADQYNKYCFAVGDIAILQDALQEIYNPDWYDTTKALIQKPTDGILQIHAMPAALGPAKDGGSDKVRVGYRILTDDEAPTFTDIYTWKHVGDIDVEQYFDGYPDLNNTTIQIHLPYIGTYNLDVSAVMGGELAVEYTTDVMTGDCIAWIWCKDRDGNYNYRYTWKGNCAKQINLQMAPMNPVIGLTAKAAPLAIGLATGTVAGTIAGIGAAMRNASVMANNISQFTQGYGGFSPIAMAQSWGDNWLMDGTTSVGSTAAVGATNIGASVMQSVKGMPSLGSSSMTSSNADTCGTVSAPSDTTCYLTITRPVWSNPEGYEDLFGVPSDIGGTIAKDFKGFLSCRTIKLDNVDATDVEKTEIANIMASGIFV